MSFDELVELVGEGAQVMMLLLFGDICCDLIDIRFRHREGAVASSSCEFPRQKIVCVDPVGGTSLEQLNQVLDRNTSWKIDKGMNMIGVYVIDLHVNAFHFSVFAKVAGHARRSSFIQQSFAIQGCPD